MKRACTPLLLALALPLLATAAPAAHEGPLFPPFGIDLTAQDKATRPQDDFFQYVNGAWLARTPIPADQPSVSMGYDERNRVQAQLHELLEAAARSAPAHTDGLEQKIGAMYAAFMDAPRIEKLGAAPLGSLVAAVRGAPSRAALARIMGQSSYDFGGSLFLLTLDVDLKDPTRYAAYLNQSGLGMPDRDYYLKPDFAAQRSAYHVYVQRLLTLIAWPNPAGAADAIVAFETRIAQQSWSKAEQRDLVKEYNPTTLEELAAAAPGFAWRDFLSGAKIPAPTRIIVGEKSAFPKLAELYAHAPLEVLRARQAFAIADTAAPYLSEPFVQARFEFRNKILSGESELQPRWKRAITAVSGDDCAVAANLCFGTLDWAVGQVYVAHHFTPETKAKVEKLVAALMHAFHARIERLDWMGAPTKAEALKKLDTYSVKVGYPEHLRDYSGLEISREDLLGDVRRAAQADWDFYVARSAGPVDRTDWIMTPQTVDAYNGNLRDIVFPAAILQPPSFDPAADDAVNFGVIGAIIGHELTHGFDDQGRTIDASGALRDWWTAEDAAAFKARATALGKEYAAFEPLPGLRIIPELTMGENIADLGGLVIAVDAYHDSLNGRAAPVLGGFSGDQRLFLGFAQGWRGKARDDSIRQMVVSNPHSYRKFRVLGPLPNIDAWYDAFNVKPDDKMYRAPAQRVHIW